MNTSTYLDSMSAAFLQCDVQQSLVTGPARRRAPASGRAPPKQARGAGAQLAGALQFETRQHAGTVIRRDGDLSPERLHEASQRTGFLRHVIRIEIGVELRARLLVLPGAERIELEQPQPEPGIGERDV